MRSSRAKRIVQIATTVSENQASGVLDPIAARRVGYLSQTEGLEEPEVSYAVLMPVATVGTGVVVIVVAIAVVMVVLFVTLSMRGRQRRGGKRRQDLADAQERAARAERDRDIAQEQSRRSDPDS
jgi:C4-dicarboxylate-specific signal transduction histidine kinase